MPTGRLSMCRIRDVLRLKYARGMSERAIAASDLPPVRVGAVRPPFAPCRLVICRRGPSGGATGCTTLRHKTHVTTGGTDAVVAYRWHPWFGRNVYVYEVIDRCAGAVARCRLRDGLTEAVQEVPVWMLDAGACDAMRLVPVPVASASALVELRGLLSDRPTGGDIDAEASGSAGVVFDDRQMGDRHAASIASLAAAVGPVRTGRTAPSAGDAVLDGSAHGNTDGADGSRGADADRASAEQRSRAERPGGLR